MCEKVEEMAMEECRRLTQWCRGQTLSVLSVGEIVCLVEKSPRIGTVRKTAGQRLKLSLMKRVGKD